MISSAIIPGMEVTGEQLNPLYPFSSVRALKAELVRYEVEVIQLPSDNASVS
jgi:hypothetical protein